MAPGSRLQELTAKYMQNPRRFFVPLANEYRKTNELDRAIALCREHLPAQPGHMSGHIVLARAYFEKGDIDAAREVFLTSVELDDENLIALRHLGDIARSRNELTEARQWYARVLDADPQNEEIERVLRSLDTPGSTLAEPIGATPFDGDVGRMPLADAPSGVVDATPPGLRAIGVSDVDMAALPGAEAGAADRLPPVQRPTVDLFDLSTLADEPASAPAPDAGPGILVDDGVGFAFDDIDELVDPASAGLASGAALPPVAEADFSSGLATPPAADAVAQEAAQDEVMSRPGFGALASFASWRSAQERETPAHVPVQPAEVPASPPADEGVNEAGDAPFWESPASDATSTAPEFVTETMAALYARQGFVQQALDVYRALLARNPADPHLAARVSEMLAALSSVPVDTSLRQDAAQALVFDDVPRGLTTEHDEPSMLESMYQVSPPVDPDAAFSADWDSPDGGADDWFADAVVPNGSSEPGYGGDEIFGVSLEAFAQPSPVRPAVGFEGSSDATAATLMSVFGAPVIAAADETAGEMLRSLATQMVGRLPKDAPTLPVPDVLDLPSSVAADEATGASPAPLLSFDRFFSGSGSPPRARIDTPAVSRATTPTWQPPAALPTPPSLSPTFGGVPVIPPPPASVTPATWAAFDQFLPSPSRPTPGGERSAPPLSLPPLPPAVPPQPASFTPAPVTPASAAPSSAAPTVGLPPHATPAPTPAPPAEPGADDQGGRSAPSDFHRWLEGLS